MSRSAFHVRGKPTVGSQHHGHGQQGNTNRAPSGPREDGSTASARYRILAGLAAWLDVSVCRAQSEDSEMMSRVPSTGCKSVARWSRFAIEGQQPGYWPAGSRSSAGLGSDGRSDKRAERLTPKLTSRHRVRDGRCLLVITGGAGRAAACRPVRFFGRRPGPYSESPDAAPRGPWPGGSDGSQIAANRRTCRRLTPHRSAGTIAAY